MFHVLSSVFFTDEGLEVVLAEVLEAIEELKLGARQSLACLQFELTRDPIGDGCEPSQGTAGPSPRPRR